MDNSLSKVSKQPQHERTLPLLVFGAQAIASASATLAFNSHRAYACSTPEQAAQAIIGEIARRIES